MPKPWTEPPFVESLRPIAVQSIFLRLLSSSYVKSEPVQDWITSQALDQSHGSLKSRGVSAAWKELNEAFENHEALVSSDFSKCFDNVHPRLAVENLQTQGLPVEWANILSFVWCHQVRWLCIGKAVHPSPEIIQNSMPQGDAFAPLALLLLLKKPVHDVSQMTGVRQVTYVDDRALSARDASQLIADVDRWRAWSDMLGLKENVEKMKFVASTWQQKQDLQDAGYGDYLCPATRMLGIDFKENDQVISSQIGNRLKAALSMAHRVQALPLGHGIRLSLSRSRVVALASGRLV